MLTTGNWGAVVTDDEVRGHLCSAIRAVQVDSGHPAPELTDRTFPLAALPGFDSLAAVDAAVRLSALMGVEIDAIPLLNEAGDRQLCIGEIVTALSAKYVKRAERRAVPCLTPTVDSASSVKTAVGG